MVETFVHRLRSLINPSVSALKLKNNQVGNKLGVTTVIINIGKGGKKYSEKTFGSKTFIPYPG